MTKLGPIEKLYALAPPGGRLVEVGVWRGDNAALMRRVAEPSLLLLVDRWLMDNDPTNVNMMGRNPDIIEATYHFVLHRFLADRNVVILRMASLDAAEIVADASMDLVYVDASHQYENVLPDLNAWSSKVKPGGILAGHDWNYYQDVNRAVADFLATHPGWSHEYLAHDACGTKAYGIRRPQ